ncbi:cupin domain-containing protein [Paenibacillus dokdonensis]|uniref:Cupin domain-containing protein n=2 Tax=Paenibacillus dokdonensis TaxID=2567944 RepID=A0ABU6GLC4_9BACL|nr:cupin domain-containing protein [Paenibacillus dokdonensis]MEC0240561.1 cupin domain-containing protein [Paenibacillus dokdonensis]
MMKVDLTNPSLNLSADSNEVVNYRRDPRNYITQLFAAQLPAVNTGFFNAYMSQGIMVNPHWHTNVDELVVVITGEIMTSVFNPFTQKLMTYQLKPGQVTQFPKGWFHWIVSLTDNTFFMTIFDKPTPDIVYASDFLRFTPKEIMNRAYCVNPEEYAKTVAPITQSVILGPPIDCDHRDIPSIPVEQPQYAPPSYPGLQAEQPAFYSQNSYGPGAPYPYRFDPNRFW